MFGLSQENLMSLVRSGLKIAGSMAVAFGLASAGQVDALTTALLQALGGIAVAVGLFASFWVHTPDAPPATPPK